MNPIEKFFRPKGVAIIGASSSPEKLSHGILANLLKYGYQGAIYPINPKSDQILGLPCYPSVLNVPDPVDLAVIVLPAPVIPEMINDCGKRGIKSVIVISGGFKEVGHQGNDLEQQVLQNAENHGIRLIGPNCVGTIDLYSGLNTTFINGLPGKGSIAFVSQSGAVCGGAVDYLMGKGLGFSHFISLGNEGDITETDMIQYLSTEPDAKVIAIYAESIKNGARFIEVCKQVTPKKPVIIIKSGRSEAGAKAVSSHTGSLAGSQNAYLAAFKQSGVIVADTLEELYAMADGFESQPIPHGNRVVIVTNAGGSAALASDALDKFGMTLATLSEDTMAKIRQHVNRAAQVENPIDMLGGAMPREYEIALDAALQDPGVDAAIAILVPTSLVPSAEVARVIGETTKKYGKPVTACMMGKASLNDAHEVLKTYHIPTYPFPETCAVVLGKLWEYAVYQSKQKEFFPTSLPASSLLASEILASADSLALGEAQTRPLLEAYGISLIAAASAESKDEAMTKAVEIGFPVAMKVISPDILHKSDSGGIDLNLESLEEVEIAYNKMIDRIKMNQPLARIQGVLIEAMSPKGIEVIVGMKRDPNFGPLLMFGLGGVYVELFKDISFRVAPLTHSEAIEMIAETGAGKLLKGLRGAAASDIDAVADVIQEIGYLAINHPEIEEIEINPLLVLPEGKGAFALDARAILSKKGHS